MDPNAVSVTSESFGKLVVKSFVLSTALTMGTFVGMAMVGFAINKIKNIRKTNEELNEAKVEL